MPRLIISPAAQRDLVGIGDFIALDDPARALSFVAEIETAIYDKLTKLDSTILSLFSHQ